MAGTPVLLVSLLLSPYVLFSANSRHVASSHDENSNPIRTLRSLENTMDKYRDLITQFKTTGRITGNSTEIESSFIYACLGLDDNAKTMDDTLKKQADKIRQLERENFNVKQDLRQEILDNRQSAGLFTLYIYEMQLRLNGLINQLDAKTLSIAKLTLRAMLEYSEYKQLDRKISKTKDRETLTDLRKQLSEKKEKLRQTEQDLIAAGGSSILVMTVIKLQEKIRILESKVTEEGDEEKLAALRKELEDKLKELEGSDLTMVTEITQLQNEILEAFIRLQQLEQVSKDNLTDLEKQLENKNSELKQLRESSGSSTSELIISIQNEIQRIKYKIQTEQKKIEGHKRELRSTIKTNEDLLKRKIEEIQEIHKTDYELIVKIVIQQFQISEMQAKQCTRQQDPEVTIVDLQKKLKDRENDILELQDKNKRLQQQLKDMSFECSQLMDKLKVQEQELEKLIQILKGDLKPILELISLRLGIQQIKMAIMAEKTASKITELTRQLKENEEKIKQKVEEIHKGGLRDAEEAVEIVSHLMEIWELQTGLESETTLNRIYSLQTEVDRLIASMKGSTQLKLLLNILAAQTDQTRIKRLKTVISEKYEKEIAGLKNRLEKMEQELSSKKSEEGKEINALQSKIESLNIKIENLKRTTSSQIADLEKQLKIREKQLEEKTKEMKIADDKNGELVIRITQLVEKIKETEINAHGKEQVLASKIFMLEKQLDNLEKENSDCKHKNTALQQENEKCSNLKDKYFELRNKTEELMQGLDESYKFILEINKLTLDIKNLQRTIAGKPDNKAELERLLKLKIKELEELQREKEKVPGCKEVIKILEVVTVMNKNRTETMEEYLKRIDELEMQVESLMSKLKNKTNANSQLVTQISVLRRTEMVLTTEIASIKQEHAKKIKDLQRKVEEIEKELKAERSKCATQATQIETLKQELSKSQTALSTYMETYGATIADLKEKLQTVTQKLQDAITKLKEGDKKHSELVLKITQLQTEMTAIVNHRITEKEVLDNEIADLKKRFGVCMDENTKLTLTITELRVNEREITQQCGIINETLNNIMTEFNETVRKVDKNTQLILRMNILITEIEALRKNIEKMPGSSAEQEKELTAKTTELEKLEQEMGLNNRMDYKLIKNALAVLVMKGNIMETDTKSYLEQIDKLNNKLDEMVDMYKGKEDENIKILIKLMSLQDEMNSLERRLAKTKQESSAKIKEIEKQLERKRQKINELKAADCGINAMNKKIAELEAEANQLEMDLAKEKKKADDQIRELEKRLMEKKNALERSSNLLRDVDSKNADLTLKLIAMETQMTTVISGSNALKERLDTMTKDLKEQLKIKEEENVRLQNTVKDLEQSKKEIQDSCSTIKQQYTDLMTKFEDGMKQINDIPKLILRMNMLNHEIERLTRQIANTSGDKTELEKELMKKREELEKVKEELGPKSPAAEQIMQIIAVMQASGPDKVSNEEYLKRIAELEAELDEKIASLKGKESEAIQAMITVMKQQDELTMLKDRLSKVKREASKEMAVIKDELAKKQQEIDRLKAEDCEYGKQKEAIAALEKKARDLEAKLAKVQQSSDKEIAELTKRYQRVEKDLNSSNSKLKDLDKDHGALITKMIGMQDKMNQLLSDKTDLKQKIAEDIADLKKQISVKDEQNAKLKEENDALKERIQETTDNCASIKQQYTDMKTKLDENIKQMDNVPKLIFMISQLNNDIDRLKKALESSTGDKTELREKLNKKIEELKKVEDDLGAKSPAANQIKGIFAVLREQAGLSTENEEEYRKRIADLESELNEKIDALQDKESENIQIMIQMMQQQEELVTLKDRLSKVREAASKKITETETQLEKKRQELNEMRAQNCNGKRQAEIDDLEREAKDLESRLKKLKQSSEKEIADLIARLKQKEKDIEASKKRLESVDKRNGALIAKSIELEKKMNSLIDDTKGLKQKTADQIADLNKQLQAKDQEIETLKAANEDCALLREKNEDMKKQLERKDKAIAALKSEKEETLGLLKDKVAELKAQQKTASELKQELDKKGEAISELQKEKDDLVAAKKTTEETTEALRKQTQISNEMELDNKQLQQKLKEKEEQMQQLQQKLDDIESEAAKKAEKVIHTSQPAIDPDTAHPKLQLSNGNTEMRLLKTSLNLPDSPMRYNHIAGALGSTGFDQGRQYWEIGVANKQCYTLGVASEKAKRNGAISFKPQNEYWTLMLSRSKVLAAAANKKQVLRVSDQAKPENIGVLLDFKKKEISFYDSETRAHLYTFTNINVKSKLFPFMSTCEDTNQGSPPLVFKAGPSADWLN